MRAYGLKLLDIRASLSSAAGMLPPPLLPACPKKSYERLRTANCSAASVKLAAWYIFDIYIYISDMYIIEMRKFRGLSIVLIRGLTKAVINTEENKMETNNK